MCIVDGFVGCMFWFVKCYVCVVFGGVVGCIFLSFVFIVLMYVCIFGDGSVCVVLIVDVGSVF